jgi:hypothetical protein
MHHRSIISVTLMASLVLAHLAAAQTREAGPWWPNPLWGPQDQSGGSNWITPEKVQQAVSLVQTGKVYELGHPYERGMPLVGGRSYNIFIPSFPTSGPFGPERMVYNDEFVAAEIGQVGTQFDGPGHPGKQMTMADGTETQVFYNGYSAAEMRHPYGLLKLGVEQVKPILTRGVLIDVAGYKDLKLLPDGYEIGMDDVRGALNKEGLDLAGFAAGDAILFNVGWWRRWPDRVCVDGNKPYLGQDVVDWVIKLQASMVGSDTVLDGPVPRVHEQLIMRNGIFNLEFMNFETVLADQVHEFLFILTPLRLKGATGSPCRPLAVR